MKILYLNHYAGSPRHGMEYRPYYLSREWVRCGDQVAVLAADYSHLRQKNPSLSAEYAQEDIDGISYHWFKTPSYAGNGVGRVINIFTFLFRLWRKSRFFIREWRPDVVIASSTYPLDIYPALHIARQTGARLVFEVHDLWPLTLIEVGGMPRWNPFVWLLGRAEKTAYRQSDMVVSMLPCAKEHMMQHGMAAEKFCYVPNGIVVSEWEDSAVSLPEEHLALLARLRAEQRFVVGYAGGHGLANALEQLIMAAGLLQEHPVSLVLVGDGPSRAELQQMVREHGLQHVHFLPSVAKPTIPALLAQMDALFIGWRKLPIYRFGINPNKLFDYMMAAKPVIHSVDAGNDIVAEADAGISVPAEDPSAIAAAIRQLMALPPEELARRGKNGRRFVLERHDYRVLADRFRSVFQGSVSKG
jgi:glycosyltransferase involved in cell wall biosynthesis